MRRTSGVGPIRRRAPHRRHVVVGVPMVWRGGAPGRRAAQVRPWHGSAVVHQVAVDIKQALPGAARGPRRAQILPTSV